MTLDPASEPHATQLQMKAIRSRDLQLWSLAVLLAVVMATGFVSLLVPRMIWGGKPHLEIPYLPQLVFGLLALIVLFNLYVFEQRRELNSARDGLLHELLRRERKASLPLIDPQTQLFNRHFLEHLLHKETARAERTAGSLAMIMVRVCGVAAVARTLGDLAADQYILLTAQMLEKACSALSMLVRYDENTFLVLMPGAAGPQALATVEALAAAIEASNQEPGRAHRIQVVSAHEVFVQGCNVIQLLHQLEQEVRRRKREADRPVGSMSPRCLLFGCTDEVTRVLRPQLESSGVVVEIAESTDAGLQMVRKEKFEGVAVECDERAALETIAQLRSFPSTRNAVLLALVGCGVSIDAAFKMGANFALPKPILPAITGPSVRAAYGLMLGERRRYFRHPIELPMLLTIGSQRLEGTLCNLSEGGLAFQTSAEVQPRDTIAVRFTFPGRRNPVEINGEVEWRDAEGKAGLRFISMSEASRSALHDWLIHQLETEAEGNLAPRRTKRAGTSDSPSGDEVLAALRS